jgi:hypothetical protein
MPLISIPSDLFRHREKTGTNTPIRNYPKAIIITESNQKTLAGLQNILL